MASDTVKQYLKSKGLDHTIELHIGSIKTIYFSPTGGTEKIAKIFSGELSRCLSLMSGESDAAS